MTEEMKHSFGCLEHHASSEKEHAHLQICHIIADSKMGMISGPTSQEP